jgi:hypothetical protein
MSRGRPDKTCPAGSPCARPCLTSGSSTQSIVPRFPSRDERESRSRPDRRPLRTTARACGAALAKSTSGRLLVRPEHASVSVSAGRPVVLRTRSAAALFVFEPKPDETSSDSVGSAARGHADNHIDQRHAHLDQPFASSSLVTERPKHKLTWRPASVVGHTPRRQLGDVRPRGVRRRTRPRADMRMLGWRFAGHVKPCGGAVSALPSVGSTNRRSAVDRSAAAWCGRGGMSGHRPALARVIATVQHGRPGIARRRQR